MELENLQRILEYSTALRYMLPSQLAQKADCEEAFLVGKRTINTYAALMHRFSSDGLRPRDASLPSRQVRKGGLPLLHTKPLPEGRPLPICASLQCREELRKAKLSP